MHESIRELTLTVKCKCAMIGALHDRMRWLRKIPRANNTKPASQTGWSFLSRSLRGPQNIFKIQPHHYINISSIAIFHKVLFFFGSLNGYEELEDRRLEQIGATRPIITLWNLITLCVSVQCAY